MKLSQIPEIIEVPRFSENASSFLEELIDKFCEDDALEIKNIEKVTNHDVKAVEYFLKQRCQSHPEISKVGFFSQFSFEKKKVFFHVYVSRILDIIRSFNYSFLQFR